MIDLEVKWSDQRRAPYVNRISIEFDGEPIGSIVSAPEEGRAQLTNFNFAHPLLAATDAFAEDAVQCGDEDTQHEPQEPPLQLIRVSPLEDQIRLLSREAAKVDTDGIGSAQALRIAVDTVFGALPRLDHDLHF